MRVGVNVDVRLNDVTARILKQAGINWIRIDVTFTTGFRSVYATAEKYGLNIVGILDYETLNYISSFTLDDWRSAVTAAKAAYPSISVWEIWNEPTVIKWQLGYMDGSPEHYLDLLRSAYSILKAGSPNSIVLGIVAVLDGLKRRHAFDKSIFDYGGGDVMDALSVHAYPDYLNVGETWNYYEQFWTGELEWYKQFGKPLWVTETGLQSNQLTGTDQATFLNNSYLFFKQQGASAYLWYTLMDYADDSQSGGVAMWGLIQRDITIKPAYAILAEFTTFPNLAVLRRYNNP